MPPTGNILLMPDGRWTAVSTKGWSSYPASKMIDGYSSTFFHSDLGTTAYQWVQINFATVVKVCRFIIQFRTLHIQR